MEVTYRNHRRHHSKENYFTPSSIGNDVNSENLEIIDFASSSDSGRNSSTERSKSRGKQHCASTNTNNVLSTTGSENKAEPRGAFQLHLDGSISIIRKEEKLTSKVKKHTKRESSSRSIIGILKKNVSIDNTVPTAGKQQEIRSKKQPNKRKIQFTSQVTIHKYNNYKRSDNRTINEIIEMLWYTIDEYEMMDIDRKHCIAYIKGALIYNYKIDFEYYTMIGLEKYLSYGQIMYAKKQEDDDMIRQKYNTDRMMKSSSSTKTTNHAYHQISQLMMKQNLNHHVHKSVYGQQKSFLLLQSDERRHRKQQKVYRSTDLIQSNNNNIKQQLPTMTLTSAATATARS